MAWNGNGNGKKILTGNLTKIWEQEGKEISPFPKFGDGKERKTQFTKFVNRNGREQEFPLGAYPA